MRGILAGAVAVTGSALLIAGCSSSSSSSSSAAGAGASTSVSFQIYAFASDGAGRLVGTPLWARKLNPDQQSDRGMQEATIPVGANPPTLIGLANIPITQGAADLAYWAGVQFQP